MENRDERHFVHPHSYRMNLHCFNYKYCDAQTHMGVIVPPPYFNQDWICDHYNIYFKENEEVYILSATPSTPKLLGYGGALHLDYRHELKFTQLLRNYYSPPLVSVPFIPISTNNDMHEHAKIVFDKLKRLLMFA